MDLVTERDPLLLDEARPASADIDSNGRVDTHKIEAQLSKLLKIGQQYDSLDHLHQFVLAFAGPWGFHVKKDSMNVICARGKQKQYKHEAHASPSKRRKRFNVVKVGCPFVIRTKYVNSSRVNVRKKKDDPGKDLRVMSKTKEKHLKEQKQVSHSSNHMRRHHGAGILIMYLYYVLWLLACWVVWGNRVELT